MNMELTNGLGGREVMGVETRILDAMEGYYNNCQNCGRFVGIGKGKTLGYWSERGAFRLICQRCETKPEVIEAIRKFKQERV